MDFEGWTLEQAKAWLREQVKGRGAKCPCCNQHAKVYRRPISSRMAYGLILMYRHFEAHPEEEWLHLPSFFTQRKACPSNDGTLMRHWGLIEGQPGERDDGSKRVGVYKLTDLGRRFVRDEVAVPKYVVLYDGVPLGFDFDEEVTIRHALKRRFDYNLLMQPVGEIGNGAF